jgi:CspA family cold shock protein
MVTRTQAVCKSWSVKKGWGFLKNPTSDQEPDVFVHYTHIEGDGFKALSEGEVVEFDLHVDDDGRPQAHGVTRMGKTVMAKKGDGRGQRANPQRKKPEGVAERSRLWRDGKDKGKGKGEVDPMAFFPKPAEFSTYPGAGLPPYPYSASALPAMMSALYDPAISAQLLSAFPGLPTGTIPGLSAAALPGMFPPGYPGTAAAARPR